MSAVAESKARRQDLIREFLARNEIGNQEQLGELLVADGYTVAQSTLSRDLREIGVVKRDGRYLVPDEHPDVPDAARRLAARLRERLSFVDAGGTVVVLKPSAGSAPAEISSTIAAAALPSVVTATATTDTVLVVTRTPGYARDLVRMLRTRPRRATRGPARMFG